MATTQTRELYKKWECYDKAEEYFTYTPPYAQLAVPRILSYYLDRFPEHEERIPFVIDLACGSGQVSELLAEHCDRVLGLDISEDQIRVARRESKHPNVTYEVSSAYEMSQHLEPGAKADLITVGGASHYFNDSDFYDEVRRCLKVGGVLAETTFSIAGMPELSAEANEQRRRLARLINDDRPKTAEYERMLDIVRSDYRTLDVLLEEVERVEEDLPLSWSCRDIQDYTANCSIRTVDAATVVRMAKEFYDDFWRRYADGADRLTVLLKVVTVFSRNLSAAA